MHIIIGFAIPQLAFITNYKLAKISLERPLRIIKDCARKRCAGEWLLRIVERLFDMCEEAALAYRKKAA
jgi:hypothetical protein